MSSSFMKVLKALPTGFADEAAAFDEAGLKAAIVKAEGSIQEVDREEEKDDALKAARANAKDLGAAYRDARKAQKAKIKYCLHLLEEKGVPLQ